MKALAAAAVTLSAVLLLGAKQSNAAGELLATRPGLELGVQAAYYRYEEPDIMKLSGNRGGLVGAYTFTDARRLFSRIDVRDSYGRLKYESSGTGTQDKVPDNIFEVRAVGGADFFPGRSFSLSPYAGLGYRYLYDDLRGYSSTGAAGYRRESNYMYAPLGLTARMHLGGGWVLAPTAEFDVFLGGRQKSYLSDTGIAGVHDVINSQDKGHGYRAYVMIEKDHWAFGGWMHYWLIEDSDVQSVGGGYAGYEPRNWTREGGLEIRYRF